MLRGSCTAANCQSQKALTLLSYNSDNVQTTICISEATNPSLASVSQDVGTSLSLLPCGYRQTDPQLRGALYLRKENLALAG